MRLVHRAALLSSTLILLLPSMVSLSSAHAFPETETPAAGQNVTTSPAEIAIKFDAPIEQLFARLQVLDTAGKDQAAGAPQVSDDARTLAVKLVPLKPGHYTVTWSVVCVDTHQTNGSYDFTMAGSGS